MDKNSKTCVTPKRSRKRILWLSILGAVLLLLVAGGIKAYQVLYQPQDLFVQSTMDPALLATPSTEPTPTPAAETTATTSSPEATAAPTAAPTPGITENKDILNILLIGIDRRAGLTVGSGKDPHADAQMIVAINFKKKSVDLISLPRDTFVHNPDLMNGVYKLNATFNVGGGFDAKDGAGFLNVCKGAEYMLGGVPVDYYYAVDFNALVKMVDAIGGVDYDVESRSYSNDKKMGKQHMTGVDVLFYLRTRKVGPAPGDLNRINRQKEMMIAIFTQLKKNGKLSMAPELINAAKSGVFTNTNLEQTIALANYAKSIDPANIGMHSMVGPSADSARWRWCFTDQKKRQKLIKDIYGIDVPEQTHCSEQYSDWLMNYGFDGIVYLNTAKQLIDYGDALQADFSDEQRKAYDALKVSHEKTKKAWDDASLSMKSTNNRGLASAKKDLMNKAVALAKLLDYKEKLDWTYSHNYWWQEPKINTVLVDFN